MKEISSLRFILHLLLMKEILSIVNEITLEFQKKIFTLDRIFINLEKTKLNLEQMKNEIDFIFEKIFMSLRHENNLLFKNIILHADNEEIIIRNLKIEIVCTIDFTIQNIDERYGEL